MERMTNNLRKLRERRGMSQMELAVRARASQMSILRAEKYGYVPGSDLRRRIAQALSTDKQGVVTEADIWPNLDELGEE
jgi:DNA-binding XRE family transcriptional regulator